MTHSGHNWTHIKGSGTLDWLRVWRWSWRRQCTTTATHGSFTLPSVCICRTRWLAGLLGRTWIKCASSHVRVDRLTNSLTNKHMKQRRVTITHHQSHCSSPHSARPSQKSSQKSRRQFSNAPVRYFPYQRALCSRQTQQWLRPDVACRCAGSLFSQRNVSPTMDVCVFASIPTIELFAWGPHSIQSSNLHLSFVWASHAHTRTHTHTSCCRTGCGSAGG